MAEIVAEPPHGPDEKRPRRAWPVRLLASRALIERLLPVVTSVIMLATVCAGIWQYFNSRDLQRIRTGFELHRQYFETFGGGVLVQLPTHFAADAEARILARRRCEYVAKEQLLDGAPDCNTNQPGVIASFLARLKPDQMAVVDKALADSPPRERFSQQETQSIQSMLSFLRAVVVCVESRTCAATTTLELFVEDAEMLLKLVCRDGDVKFSLAPADDVAEMLRSALIAASMQHLWPSEVDTCFRGAPDALSAPADLVAEAPADLAQSSGPGLLPGPQTSPQ